MCHRLVLMGLCLVTVLMDQPFKCLLTFAASISMTQKPPCREEGDAKVASFQPLCYRAPRTILRVGGFTSPQGKVR